MLACDNCFSSMEWSHVGVDGEEVIQNHWV